MHIKSYAFSEIHSDKNVVQWQFLWLIASENEVFLIFLGNFPTLFVGGGNTNIWRTLLWCKYVPDQSIHVPYSAKWSFDPYLVSETLEFNFHTSLKKN